MKKFLKRALPVVLAVALIFSLAIGSSAETIFASIRTNKIFSFLENLIFNADKVDTEEPTSVLIAGLMDSRYDTGLLSLLQEYDAIINGDAAQLKNVEAAIVNLVKEQETLNYKLEENKKQIEEIETKITKTIPDEKKAIEDAAKKELESVDDAWVEAYKAASKELTGSSKNVEKYLKTIESYEVGHLREAEIARITGLQNDDIPDSDTEIANREAKLKWINENNDEFIDDADEIETETAILLYKKDAEIKGLEQQIKVLEAENETIAARQIELLEKKNALEFQKKALEAAIAEAAEAEPEEGEEDGSEYLVKVAKILGVSVASIGTGEIMLPTFFDVALPSQITKEYQIKSVKIGLDGQTAGLELSKIALNICGIPNTYTFYEAGELDPAHPGETFKTATIRIYNYSSEEKIRVHVKFNGFMFFKPHADLDQVYGLNQYLDNDGNVQPLTTFEIIDRIEKSESLYGLVVEDMKEGTWGVIKAISDMPIVQYEGWSFLNALGNIFH